MGVVHFTWECPACAQPNLKNLEKPGYYQSIVIDVACAICESLFVMKVSKARGITGALSYIVVSGRVTEKGNEAFRERHNKKEVTTTPAIAGQPKGN